MSEGEEEGEKPLFQKIMVLVVVIAVFAVLLSSLNKTATGKLAQEELLAKQICIIVTAAESGTEMNLTTEMIVEKKENGINIRENSLDIGFFYACENTNFEISKASKNTIIKIN